MSFDQLNELIGEEVMTKVSEFQVPGDLIVHMESFGYCLADGIIRNGLGSAITLEDVVGVPLVAGTNSADWDLLEAGNEANVTALLVRAPAGVKSESIAATTNSSYKYQVLHRSPVIINKDAIKTVDQADAALDVDAIVTALEALGWEVRTEPVNTETID